MPCYILTDKAQDKRFFKKTLLDPIFYETPSALISALRKVKNGQVVILDSTIRGFNKAGLKTAQLIRQKDPDAQLIMISDNASLVGQCFEAQVGFLDFIIKQDFSSAFLDRLLRAIAKANLNLRRILELRPIPIRLPHGKTSKVFDLTRVIYITTDKGTHHLFVHEADRLSRIHASMASIPDCHDSLFQIHASFTINIAYLHDYDCGTHIVTMVTGHRLPVSRLYAGALREALRWPTAKKGVPIWSSQQVAVSNPPAAVE
ncbi:DNA-binding response regulator [Fructobacillus sp. M2-14]|uniref:DNA-binding response regulator n=1 Tax=Fructobacillus broussonetiae TaxID=2713173 RepID=A0ABS5R3J1_9LACO|nr:LytTR family DNA-binding domain-containing protein [Fructobacillus broussonetiae]MBS9338727.1 DNA-binding response regulator [Fructobacillus broussonetiae]